MSKTKNILVLGANGQLGKMYREMQIQFPLYNFTFLSREECDITDPNSINKNIDNHTPSIIINCAAYTAVDKAETEIEQCFSINAEAVKQIAEACKNKNILLMHYSTDYVYHLNTKSPLKESDLCKPVGQYAKSKEQGEKFIVKSGCEYIIIRTSWVYSEYGNNFVKTMLRLSENRNELSIVNDQIGSPTYTRDIVDTSIQLIETGIKNQIYNFANDGQISWYDFAKEIFLQKGIQINLKPIPTSDYPTPASRPLWSVMDFNKITSIPNIKIKDWKTSLRTCLNKLG